MMWYSYIKWISVIKNVSFVRTVVDRDIDWNVSIIIVKSVSSYYKFIVTIPSLSINYNVLNAILSPNMIIYNHLHKNNLIINNPNHHNPHNNTKNNKIKI